MHVHRGQRLPTQQETFDILHCQPLESNMRVDRASSIVRSHHDLGMASQTRVHIRFFGMHIQTSSGKTITIQGLKQCLLVDQRPTGNVNEPRPGLELLQPLLGYKRLARERRRNDNAIRVGQQVVQLGEIRRIHSLLLLRAFAEEIVIVDLHSIRRVDLAGNGEPDLTHSHDPQTVATRVVRSLRGVLVRIQEPLRVDRVRSCIRPVQVAEDCQDQEQGHIRDGFGRCGSTIAVDDSYASC